MKDAKKTVAETSSSLGLGECFSALEQHLSHAIETIDEIKVLKPARTELKKYRLAIAAIERQIKLFEKDRRI
jgi:hypothetical protein